MLVLFFTRYLPCLGRSVSRERPSDKERKEAEKRKVMFYNLHGTVSALVSDPPCKDGNV